MTVHCKLEHAGSSQEQKIVHEDAVLHHCLRADASLVRQKISDFEAWAILATRLEIAGVLHFFEPVLDISEHGLPETWKGGVFSHVMQIERKFGIAFARETQHGVWTYRHAAVHHPR